MKRRDTERSHNYAVKPFDNIFNNNYPKLQAWVKNRTHSTKPNQEARPLK